MPNIISTTKRNGLAGQVAFDVVVDYDGQRLASSFIGQASGGPVVMQSGSFETFVAEPERFGPGLSAAWVQRFYAA